jgi:hypothetical protein
MFHATTSQLSQKTPGRRFRWGVAAGSEHLWEPDSTPRAISRYHMWALTSALHPCGLAVFPGPQHRDENRALVGIMLVRFD